MKRFLLLLGWYLLVGQISLAWPASCPGQAAETVRLGSLEFRLAPGLTIERVATEPLIKWPVVADWDAEGRLVVVESGGVAKPIQEHNKQLLHRVVRLVDDDQDGVFDRRVVAADRLPFPEGVLCLGNDLLVAAPPHLWKLTDADGDGRCESREIWFDGQTITGCANDLHGPYLGRDGFIYWCKGAFAEQTHTLLDGTTLTDSAAHIYRRRPAGGAIEPVMSGGMDNPVEVAFSRAGERFFTSTFLQHPGDGLRDGMAHAIYGGVYGKQQRAIDGLTRTGPLMPIMTQLGPAAPSGLLCLASPTLLDGQPGAQDWDVLVAAQFNLQKVSAHRLHPMGASFRTEDIDLVVADRVDFHPTDVLEDADGSLLIIDTGGWYGLCCPTSRIDQQTAAGGIYRIRRREATADAPGLAHLDPAPEDWSLVDATALVRLLEDPRPWIVRRAQLQLAAAATPASITLLGKLLNDASQADARRLQALWTLCALNHPTALQAIADMLDCDRPALVQAACHAVSVQRFLPAKEPLENLLHSASGATPPPAATLRVAAEALGRIGDAQSVAAIMPALQAWPDDLVLRHSLLYALIELRAPEAVASYLDSSAVGQRLAAIRVLDALDSHTTALRHALVAGLAADELNERATAIEILSKHPAWIGDVASAIDERWHSSLAQAGNPAIELADLLAAWRDEPALAPLLAGWLQERESPPARTALISLLQAQTGWSPPAACVPPLNAWLREDPLVVADLLTHLDLSARDCQPLLETLEQQIAATADVETQLKLVASLPPAHRLELPALAASATDWYTDETSPKRTAARTALQRLRIDPATATQIVDALPQLPAVEWTTALELVSTAGHDAVDAKLLERLPRLPAARTLPANFIANLYRGRNQQLKQQASQAEERLQAPSQDVAQQVEQLLAVLPAGDPVRGLTLFRSSQAACAGCHQMGYVGGKIGPELTRIGASRTRAALLEAILFPSSRIEQSYQATKVLTLDGQVLNGLVQRATERELELVLTAERSVVLATSEIERQEVSPTSIMPAGMLELLSHQQLADLLALLESSR